MNSEERGKEGFVRKLFDTISPRYDLFNRLSSFGLDRRWRKRTIEHLHLLPGMRVLDLATGTGDLAHAAVQPLVPLGLVVGCDLSGDMLSCAQKKLSESPAAYWHVQLTQGRAEALPFLSNSLDGVTMGFALRNVTNLNDTLREFHRVLKPGGRISLLELGRPQGIFIRWGHRLWLMIGVL